MVENRITLTIDDDEPVSVENKTIRAFTESKIVQHFLLHHQSVGVYCFQKT